MLLDWQKTNELLKKYQIPLVESLVIENIQQGIEFANKVGFPVVLKLLSQDNLHKVDKGLVKLNIQNKQDLTSNFAILSQQDQNDGGYTGCVIIQKQVVGTELFLGMKRDKSFGCVISFGLGGIFVEVLEDIGFGICPINKEYALEIIKSIKGYKVLTNYRGRTPVNLEKLADIVMNISKLAVENENIQEIDFNPVMANGSEILIVDPKVIMGHLNYEMSRVCHSEQQRRISTH